MKRYMWWLGIACFFCQGQLQAFGKNIELIMDKKTEEETMHSPLDAKDSNSKKQPFALWSNKANKAVEEEEERDMAGRKIRPCKKPTVEETTEEI